MGGRFDETQYPGRRGFERREGAKELREEVARGSYMERGRWGSGGWS